MSRQFHIAFICCLRRPFENRSEPYTPNEPAVGLMRRWCAVAVESLAARARFATAFVEMAVAVGPSGGSMVTVR